MTWKRPLLILTLLLASLTLTPAATTAQIDYGVGYQAAIYDACARHGCSGDQLVRVAGCESGYNPNAVGPNGEIGLFQFEESTFYAHGGGDIWNPYDQIEVAAQMWGSGLGWHWVCQ
jgi:hypothetical protein